jgi:hypothetical protein
VDCWICERPALAACRFCGRGACREHAKSHPFVLDIYRGAKRQALRALVVEDAIHCGVCRPRGEPVDMPELEEGRRTSGRVRYIT